MVETINKLDIIADDCQKNNASFLKEEPDYEFPNNIA
jgi:hypothetical protein